LPVVVAALLDELPVPVVAALLLLVFPVATVPVDAPVATVAPLLPVLTSDALLVFPVETRVASPVVVLVYERDVKPV
jgi:hypothetical protein